MYWLIPLGLGYLAAEAYKQYVPEETKKEWERKIHSHHGEWGLLGTIVGIATGHYSLAASSTGLAIHDWNDRNKWFTGDKEKESLY